MVLSILIATMPSRKQELRRLLENLRDQCEEFDDVEILINSRMDVNIGQKRNLLLAEAKGDYIVFVDDDDHVSENYVWCIIQACAIGNDCIGISGTITTNGLKERQWHISKAYGKWHERNNIYYRTPNHISPIRRELALAAGFPEIAHGEDFEYSKRLLPLLKSETIIKGNLYWYDFKTIGK